VIATNPDATAFLSAILAEPEEDTHRLVFADWLEEHGGDAPRANFIRAQVQQPQWFKSRPWEPSPRLSRDPERYVEALAWLNCNSADADLADLLDCPCTCCGCDGEWVWQRQAKQPGTDAPVILRVLWQRGFIERVECHGRKWDAHAKSLTANHPIQAVTITTWADAPHTDLMLSTAVYCEKNWPKIAFSFPVPAPDGSYDPFAPRPTISMPNFEM
jgi:uncharacterized protein (TIGR02996 family)